MENKNSQSKMNTDFNQLFKLLVIVVAIMCLLFLAYKLGLNKTKTNKVSQSAIVEKTNIDFSKIPARFPDNVPLEAGATITQNFNATTPEGQFQATRTFETKQSLADNLTIYNEFLKSAGWTITSTVDNPTHKMVIASLGKKSLQISMDQNKVTQIKTVNISYVENR